VPIRIPFCALLALSAIGCSRHAPTAGVAPAAADAAVAGSSECLPDRTGYLRLRVRGARNLDIDWRDAELQCDGGPRPGQAGLRLTFAARNPSGEPRLRLVLGIAVPPAAGSSRAVPANVTLIFEGENRLYSTRGDDKCTIDELQQTPIAASHALRVAGRGFCAAPAAAIDGRDDVLLSRFDFAGRVFDDSAADHPQ
jgi:hypothetical protein